MVAELAVKEIDNQIKLKKIGSIALKNEDKIIKRIQNEGSMYDSIRQKVQQFNRLIHYPPYKNSNEAFELNRQIDDDYVFFLKENISRRNNFIDTLESYKSHKNLKNLGDKEHLKVDEYNFLKLEKDSKLLSLSDNLDADIEKSLDASVGMIKGSPYEEELKKLKMGILEDMVEIDHLKKSMKPLFDV